MKAFAREFYNSKAWKDCRIAYTKSKGGLCERCLKNNIYRAGEIVHHKTYLTPDNIHDPSVTLDWNNLMLVCRDCHAVIHSGRIIRYKVDELGRVQAWGD